MISGCDGVRVAELPPAANSDKEAAQQMNHSLQIHHSHNSGTTTDTAVRALAKAKAAKQRRKLEAQINIWLRPNTRANGTRQRMTIWRGAMGSYPRLGGRLSDRVLKKFVWQGQRYAPTGQKLSDTSKPSNGWPVVPSNPSAPNSFQVLCGTSQLPVSQVDEESVQKNEGKHIGGEIPLKANFWELKKMQEIKRTVTKTKTNQFRHEWLNHVGNWQDALSEVDEYQSSKTISYSGRNSKIREYSGSPLDHYASTNDTFGKIVTSPINLSKGNDNYAGNSLGIGIAVSKDGVLNTLGGDDVISGIGSGAKCGGIFNQGSIYTDSGNDMVVGYSNGKAEYGVKNKGLIDTGGDNDFIAGSGRVTGIENFGYINTRSGGDTIVGTGSLGGKQSDNLWGIKNYGKIETGSSKDAITGRGKLAGITNESLFGKDKYVSYYDEGVISMGAGDDLLIGHGDVAGIVNKGKIEMGNGTNTLFGSGGIVGIENSSASISFGNGHDKIGGESVSSNGTAILNNYLINTHDGNDMLCAKIGKFINNGSIKLGKGNDFVIAHESAGFEGTGTIDLEEGNDILTGFGGGKFLGGSGVDMLLLPKGTYQISGSIVTDNFQIMNASGFEKIGGIGSAGLNKDYKPLEFADGILTVNSDGDANFQGSNILSKIQIFNP